MGYAYSDKVSSGQLEALTDSQKTDLSVAAGKNAIVSGMTQWTAAEFEEILSF